MSNDDDKIDDSQIIDDSKKDLNDRVKDFSSLLTQIENITDKKRQLWIEIYENAINDRQYAHIMFSKLVKITEDKSVEHAVHGRTISSYIERMSKANDQLIKLAELIARAENKNDDINPDDLFERINKKH